MWNSGQLFPIKWLSVNFCRPFLLNQKQDVGWLLLRNRSSRPEVFCRTSVLKTFAKFTGKHLCQSLFFTKVAGAAWNFIKKENLEQRELFLRTTFFIEHIWWLLLKKVCRSTQNMFFTHYNQSNTFCWLTCRKQKLVQSKILQQRLLVLILGFWQFRQVFVNY